MALDKPLVDFETCWFFDLALHTSSILLMASFKSKARIFFNFFNSVSPTNFNQSPTIDDSNNNSTSQKSTNQQVATRPS